MSILYLLTMLFQLYCIIVQLDHSYNSINSSSLYNLSHNPDHTVHGGD